MQREQGRARAAARSSPPGPGRDAALPSPAARRLWRRLDRVRWLGPGLAMAATAIGASHLVLAPTAGALFGYALLWIMPFSHLFKYPAFEFGPRFAVATGGSLLDGYARVPGPRGWALWAFLAGTVVQGFSVLAGVLGVAAAVASAAFPFLPLPAWSGLLAVAGAAILATGGFDGLSAASKGMLFVLAAMTAAAFLATPPPPEAWSRLVWPALPAGSLVLAAAILGWMPTGLDVSVWHSMWALERRAEWEERAGSAGPRAVLRVARADLNAGYGLSLALAVAFVALGAEVLRPAGRVPQGAEVALTLARLYTEVLGGWSLPLFLLAAFAGMFSTALGVLDGFPRAFAAALRRAWRGAPAEGRLAWGFLWAIVALAVAETVLLPDPVVLVTVAAVASFLLAPLTFALNYYCVTRLIPDPALRAGAWLRGWALGGIACVAAATGLFLLVHFG